MTRNKYLIKYKEKYNYNIKKIYNIKWYIYFIVFYYLNGSVSSHLSAWALCLQRARRYRPVKWHSWTTLQTAACSVCSGGNRQSRESDTGQTPRMQPCVQRTGRATKTERKREIIHLFGNSCLITDVQLLTWNPTKEICMERTVPRQ